MSAASPRMLVVAHGTTSAAGSATTARLVAAIRAVRPGASVDLCFLDVAAPRLPDALDDRPTVVVPLLLSTGYHVQSDIPGAVAAYPQSRVARHLGPHPLLAEALADRLGPLGQDETVLLAGAGSSRPEAAGELAEMGWLLGRQLDREIATITVGEDVRAVLHALPRPARIATYLLAEGQFCTALNEAADGLVPVAPPIGVHPALVQLVWQRYTEIGARP